MAQTIYASFADASLAEKAAGALLDYGARQEDLSIVANDAQGHATAHTAGNRIEAAGDRAAGAVTGAVGATATSANYEAAANAHDAAGTATLTAAHSETENAAKHGISTTTPGDAGVGAAKGAGIGLGVGVLAGLASLLVPGVGLVYGAGALATAIGGAIGTTVAGAVAGGVTGYLKDQGVPDEAAQRYHGTVEQGGALLSIALPSGKLDEATAHQVLSKYGGSDVSAY